MLQYKQSKVFKNNRKIMGEIFPEIRRQEILDWLRRDGQVSVSELSRKFGVSEVTIRNDLQILAERNLIIRTHGGAIPLEALPEISLNLRRTQKTSEKERIGDLAAQLIEDGEAVFLDTSSTALALMTQLKKRRELTIITNSLAVPQTGGDSYGISIVLIGGIYQRDTDSLVGLKGIEMLRQFHIQKGFFGAHGISDPEGLTDVSYTEAELKREVVKMCRQVIAIIDSSKWNRVGFSSFARLEDIQTVVTDMNPPDPWQEKLMARGITLITNSKHPVSEE